MRDQTTIRWIAGSGPVNLKGTKRTDTERDMRPATGVLVGILAGVNAWIWAYVIVRAFL